MVGRDGSLFIEGSSMTESETETDDVKDVIPLETSSSQLIAALRSQSYRRFDEPRFRLWGRSFPLYFVPLVLFFVFLLGFFACLVYVSAAADFVFLVWKPGTVVSPSKSPERHRSYGKSESPTGCSDIPLEGRIDCLPDGAGEGAESRCHLRGCCWFPAPEPPRPHNLIPWCFYPSNRTYYHVKNKTSSRKGVDLVLTLTDPDDPKIRYLPDVVRNLKVELIYLEGNIARVRITDFDKTRYQVPNLRLPDVGKTSRSRVKKEPDFSFEVGNFSLVVRRRCDGMALFDTRLAPLIFADQFLQITTALPGNKVFGLGEHRTGAATWDMNWTRAGFWALDQAPKEDVNLYGAHPVMMVMGNGNFPGAPPGASGIFLLNSNAMEIVLQPYPAVTFRTIGGVLDFFIYSGPTPDDVMAAHWSVVGRPAAPPHWALGFHLCRWGYESDKDLSRQIESMRSGGFPYTTQWNDIDYMHEKLDFTVDQQRYLNLTTIVHDLHEKSQRYVMILDPGIANFQPKGDYPPYDDGIAQDVFVKDENGLPIVGAVWPGNTVFPDFTSLNANLWWTKNLQDLQDRIHFDGVWIDMNEPSNFVHGSTGGCDKSSKLDFPFYIPTALYGHTYRLFVKTLCGSAQHAMGNHFDLHSLYGLFEMRATHYAMKSMKPSNRPLIISRSTFPYAGQYGGHWLGDNSATWVDLKSSITGILNFNFFGIPLVGADICGFNGNTEPELCLRWMQLGAFYPFMRNHNTVGANPQDPPSFKSPAIRDGLRKALRLRYTNLPFLYSNMLKASVEGTIPVRALFMNFFDDTKTWGVNDQFMWGKELMITPVLDAGKTEINAFFPVGIWYDWMKNTTVRIAPPSGRFVPHLPAPLDHIPVWIRGGKTIVQRIPDFENNLPLEGKLRIIVALDEIQESRGIFLWDDEGDAPNDFPASATVSPPPPSYLGAAATLDALAAIVTPSAPLWHFGVEFSWRDGVLATVTRYEWGEVRSTEARDKASHFLRRKLRVGEILVLGKRPPRGGKEGEGEAEEEEEDETSISFFLEKAVSRKNNSEEEEEEEERRKKRKSLDWEKYGENGFLLKIRDELDLTTEFLIFSR